MAVLWLVVLSVVVAGQAGQAIGQAQWDSVAVTVPYGEERIAVFRPDKERVPEMFYFMPLVRFIPESPVYGYSYVTGKIELKFQILMWSPEILEVVHQYLKTYLDDDSIRVKHVEPLPMERIRLVWKNQDRPLFDSLILLSDWRAHTDSPTMVRGQFLCASNAVCDNLQKQLKQEPESVHGLEMEYVVNLQSRRQLTLTGSQLTRTNLYASLSGMPVQSNVRYLTEEAADTLAKQTVAVALSALISNSADAQDELTLTNQLANKLKSQQVSTKSILSGMWDSLYWEHGPSRPDKVADFLNDVLKPDASDANYFTVLEEKINANDEYKQCAQDLGILTSGGNSFVNRVQKQTVLDAVTNKLRVSMEGDKFVVEDFPLYRLNLAAWSSSASLVSSPVRARSEAVHSAKVRVQTDKFTSQLTPELVQARLQTQIDNRFQTVANVFSAWPEYCRLPSYYCNYRSNSALAYLYSVKTHSGCMTECDTNVRCQSFQVSTTDGCRLINSICTYGYYKSHSAWEYNVKLSRVPEITAHMWRAIFADGNLGELPADPCMLLGDHGFVFTQVPPA